MKRSVEFMAIYCIYALALFMIGFALGFGYMLIKGACMVIAAIPLYFVVKEKL